jgi:hypothetical protein
VSLAVSTGNAGAHRLYARLGYVNAGVPLHRTSTSDHDPAGTIGSGNETVVDLVKRIDGPVAADPRRPGARAPSAPPGTRHNVESRRAD